jgi:hypothetical protein
LLGTNNHMNELEILRLNNLVLLNNQEIERLKIDNDFSITNLNETIAYFQDSTIHLNETISIYQALIVQLYDSLLILQTTSNGSPSLTNTSNDFLNKYFDDQIPLPNNSFSFVLSKLFFHEVPDYYDRSDQHNSHAILDISEFKYWGTTSNMQSKSSNRLKDYVYSLRSNSFHSKLPTIEVLKNKLFTIKYNEGSEESFLFNTSSSSPTVESNQRRILQIELATEDVDGSNDKSQDIIWDFFVIEDECYLALSLKQLNRLNVKLLSWNKIWTDYNEYNYDSDLYNQSNVVDLYGYSNDELDFNGRTTGEGIYLSINKYNSTASYFLNLDKIIFLFKLQELE